MFSDLARSGRNASGFRVASARQSVTASSAGASICWRDNGTIVFSVDDEPAVSGLRKRSATSGASTPLTNLDVSHGLQHVLQVAVPGGRFVVFAALQRENRSEEQQVIEVVAVDTGKRSPLLRGEVYRFRHSSHTAKARIKSREQARLKTREGIDGAV